MERGATVTCVFEFPAEVDFENVSAMRLYVRGSESGTKIIKSLEDNELVFMSENRVRVDFSQEDTLRFANCEDLRMQWHWRNENGSAKTSLIIETDIYEFLGSEPI